MHHNHRSTNRIVALFVLFGIAILAVFTAMILINNKTFADKSYYRTVVQHAKGLSAKPAVLFKGLEIGRVESFRLNPINNDIEVDFWVFDEYKGKIVRHALLIGHQNTLLGDISPFELVLPQMAKVINYEVLPPGELVPHFTSELGQAYIRNGLVLVEGDSIDSIIASVNTLLLNLQQENNPDAGSLFRILDRIAKITDHLLSVSESLRQSQILPEAEKMLLEGKGFLSEIPATLNQINQLLASIDKTVNSANQVLSGYEKPADIVNDVTDGKIPPMLDNVNASVDVLRQMLADVHAEREQLVITINGIQKVLDRLDKTLQGVNNNPLIKPGIEQKPTTKGIEMNEH